MAEVGKKESVLNVKSTSMSPKDLEAEIAATAQAISELETVDGATVASPKSKPSKKGSASKADEGTSTQAKKASKKQPTKKGRVMSTSDVRPGVRPPKKSPTKAEIKGEDSSGPSAVMVTVKPKSIAVQPDSPNKAEVAPLTHIGKDIKPLSDKPKSADQATSSSPSADEQKKSAPTAITSKVKINNAKPYDVIKVAEKSSNRHGDEGAVDTIESNNHSNSAHISHRTDSPHVARIYDSKTYHIPLSVDRHHRKAMMPAWAWALTILIGIATAASYFIYTR